MQLTKWRLYLIVALAFAAGVFGIRSMWLAEGEAKLRAKVETQRRKAIEEAKEIRNEVEALDRRTLEQRASRWVRNPER